MSYPFNNSLLLKIYNVLFFHDLNMLSTLASYLNNILGGFGKLGKKCGPLLEKVKYYEKNL